MAFIKNFLLGSIFFVTSTAISAQTLSIGGKVYSSDRTPVEDAHIYLSSKKWAVTGSDGSFVIKNLEPGSYVLTVSRIGFRDEKIAVDLLKSNQLDLEVFLQERIYGNDRVVVTASRTEKKLEDTSVPVSVIDEEEIELSGSMRLSDILSEQIGMNIVSDHGTGIQVQGFDPEYTLIMIDNQPVIGRSAGTLDLTRLAIGNVEQIEIVKGPSSALWGSDALAGVINIITNKGSDPFQWDINSRYGTNNSFDGSSNITFKKNRINGRFFANINGSDGYDLDEESLAPTVPEFHNYTFSGGLNYRASDRMIVRLNGRYFQEDLSYLAEATTSQQSITISGDQSQKDYSFSPEIAYTLGNKQLFELIGFTSRFLSESNEINNETQEDFFSGEFDQALTRIEFKSSTFWSDEHTSVSGVGLTQEDLISDNYADVPTFTSYFLFGQHEWKVSEKLSFTGGFRFDNHSEYSSQFSPKFSTLFKPNNKIHFRASVGRGFKAPAFNQLFLNFTNATVGYTVFGTSTVIEGMQQLQESGRIDSVLISPNNVTDINAERSFSYNAGFDLFPTNSLQFKINFFRNNVQNMIDWQQIALKTNAQSVFSYFNLDQVYTQGFESVLQLTPEKIPGLRVGVGYQFLDARQEFKVPFDEVINGVVVSRNRTEYGVLPNRSKHNANLKLFYFIEEIDLETSFRAIFRGRFGIDFNGNERIDRNEYVFKANNVEEAFDKTILNFSVAKTFGKKIRWMFGVDNISNFQDAQFLPSNPGLTFYTQLNIKLH